MIRGLLSGMGRQTGQERTFAPGRAKTDMEKTKNKKQIQFQFINLIKLKAL